MIEEFLEIREDIRVSRVVRIYKHEDLSCFAVHGWSDEPFSAMSKKKKGWRVCHIRTTRRCDHVIKGGLSFKETCELARRFDEVEGASQISDTEESLSGSAPVLGYSNEYRNRLIAILEDMFGDRYMGRG
jgi:hypothetical protein